MARAERGRGRSEADIDVITGIYPEDSGESGAYLIPISRVVKIIVTTLRNELANSLATVILLAEG